MPRKRTHLVLPDDLLAEVDAVVGPRGRSAFLAEVVRDAVSRRRLLRILSDPEPVWRDEDHPELAEGADVWVRRMRDQDAELERQRSGKSHSSRRE